MKITCLFLLAAVMGASLSFGASVTGQTPSYTKGETVYNGTTGDTLTTSSPTISLKNDNNGEWTMALTISGLSVTGSGKTGLLFTCNSSNSIFNALGLGYRLTADGALTLCAGGYNYNGVGSGGNNDYAGSPWKTQAFSGYSTAAPRPLNLFYVYNKGAVSIKAMWGDDESTLTTLASLGKGSGVTFSSNVSQINFSAKDGTTTEKYWSAPDGVTGAFTLNNFDVYTSNLTDVQMIEYAASAFPAVPEPAAASLGLLGLGALMTRRRRQA